MANEKVKVKILCSVGHYTQGQEVEVSEADANAMCTVRKRHDGHKLIDYQTAMRLEDWENLKNAPVDKGGLTQDELEALGEKNVVKTPHDPTFEAKLAAAKKASEAQEADSKSRPKNKKFQPAFKEQHEESA